MTGEPLTLYVALGGEVGIAAVVDRFYARMVADPKVAVHFVHVSLQALKPRKTAFLAAICGGPAGQKGQAGRSLQQAHAPYRLTQADFERMTGHFAEALADCLIPPDPAERMLTLVGRFRHDVISLAYPEPASPEGDT